MSQEDPEFQLAGRTAGDQTERASSGLARRPRPAHNLLTNPDLTKAAVEVVSKWRYKPSVVDGVPAEVLTNVTVNFAFSK